MDLVRRSGMHTRTVGNSGQGKGYDASFGEVPTRGRA